MTDIESLRRLTEAVETAGADIAPTYLEYVQLSFAIATDCGEAGREFFHRLCRVSPKYQREHAERVFSNALHTQRGEVHLGTAFHLAEATGVSICIEEMPKHPTGTKGTAGTARKFPPHTGAPSASGKGILSYIRLLVEPIHDEIRKEVAIQMKAYKKEKAEYDAMGKERTKKEAPQMPPNRMFLISGNNTGTGILQNIMDSDGTGLICEAEADTLSTAIGSDHGHWSDTLRKAFDHDRLSYNRRTDQEYREVKKSYLSVLISGTPSQVQTFIPTAEDGSYSRQLYYYMCGISKWISQFMGNEIDWEEIFTAMGLEWKEKLSVIKSHGIHTLQLTDEQKEEIDTVFSDLFERSSVANGREMYSFVARLAVNLCRIMSEIAVLRALESPQPYDFKTSPTSPFTPDKEIPADNRKDDIITRWDVSISQEDFHAVLSLAEPLYCHATHILSFLPSTEVSHRPNADRDYLFQKLGDEFTRTQLLEEAVAMGIKENTALTWLKRLTKHGKLISMDGKGLYARACVYE